MKETALILIACTVGLLFGLAIGASVEETAILQDCDALGKTRLTHNAAYECHQVKP